MAKKKTNLDDIVRMVATHGKQMRDLATTVEKDFAAVAADIADIRHDMVDMKRVHSGARARTVGIIAK